MGFAHSFSYNEILCYALGSQLGAAVRTAQAIGLHRDPTTLVRFRYYDHTTSILIIFLGYGCSSSRISTAHMVSLMSMFTDSFKGFMPHRSYLYHADRSFALILGRPIAIQDDYTSTLPPSNIDDELGASQLTNPPPLSSPTPTTLAVLRHSLAGIIGRIVHHFQQVRKPSHYADVLHLDDELSRYVDRLPPHYAFEPDTSLDASKKYIPVHRFLLITEILSTRVILHRPYLLRRLHSDRYARSRTACFESALKDFRVRQVFRDAIPRELRDSLVNTYREFQSAMMSGIYLVLHPKGDLATDMHAILDSFLQDHEGVRDMDETTRRELKTIEFLKKKVSQVTERVEGANGMDTDEQTEEAGHPIDAQLLLGLQQSNTRTSTRPPQFSHLNTENVSSSRGNHPPYFDSPTVAPSPMVQLLQQNAQSEYATSPNSSGSPSADDESAAQSLLDYWCNTVGSTDSAPGGSTGMQWGPSGDPTGFSASVGNPPLLGEPSLISGVGGSDWTYWETLVNEIRAGPSV